MEKDSFKFCAGCYHLRKDPSSNERSYYCPLVIDDIPDGRVYPDTDASKCVSERRYLSREGRKETP